MKLIDRYHDVIQSIINNVERDGLERYDRIDIKFMPSLLKMSRKNVFGKYLRYSILAIDEVMPITVRKICGIQKTIPPTTYTFLGNSYLNIEQMGIAINKSKSAGELVELCISHYLSDDGSDCWWDLNITPYLDVMPNDVNKRKTMHIHGLARCNILLLRLFYCTDNERYFDIAYRTAHTTLKHHNMRRYKDNTISISYYPYTDDCTLNICSEFCQWLAMILVHKEDNELRSILHDMVQLLINEQSTDGSFPYTAKQNESEQPGKSTIDCHHTGTVLGNLICVLEENVLYNDQQKELEKAIYFGMKSYFDIFIDEDSGIIKSGIPGPTQYGEAILALCKYQEYAIIRSKKTDLFDKINSTLPKLVSTMINFVNTKNGSCPSEKVIFWQHINSIRWGNGVILNAVTEYLLLLQKYGSETEIEE